MNIEVASDWYHDFFGQDWLHLATQLFPPERTRAQVDFVLQVAELPPGAAVLDLCCGHGRHSVELARRGYRVTGLDLSMPSLALARAAAAEASVQAEFVQGDMRRIPHRAAFDLVINLFTAFGYLEDEAEDQQVLHSIAQALKPGGRLVLDTINHAWLMRHLEPRGWSQLDDGTILLEEHEFDLERGRNNVTWTFLYPDGRRHVQSHSLRVYTLAELALMLRAARLALRQVWGGFQGQPFTLDSRRMILLAEQS